MHDDWALVCAVRAAIADATPRGSVSPARAVGHESDRAQRPWAHAVSDFDAPQHATSVAQPGGSGQVPR
jgi:hypothetical protein